MMTDEIVPDGTDIAAELVKHYAMFLADFRERMTPRQADRYLRMPSNTVLGAIQRGEIQHYKRGNRYQVTPIALAKWLERYDKPIEPNPLPG